VSSYIYITLHTAERGVSDAQYKLGCYLLSGGEGETADKGAAAVVRRESNEEALRWIRMAADGGHAEAGESVAISP
jgi:TPR repeat protein